MATYVTRPLGKRLQHGWWYKFTEWWNTSVISRTLCCVDGSDWEEAKMYTECLQQTREGMRLQLSYRGGHAGMREEILRCQELTQVLLTDIEGLVDVDASGDTEEPQTVVAKPVEQAPEVTPAALVFGDIECEILKQLPHNVSEVAPKPCVPTVTQSAVVKDAKPMAVIAVVADVVDKQEKRVKTTFAPERFWAEKWKPESFPALSEARMIPIFAARVALHLEQHLSRLSDTAENRLVVKRRLIVFQRDHRIRPAIMDMNTALIEDAYFSLRDDEIAAAAHRRFSRLRYPVRCGNDRPC